MRYPKQQRGGGVGSPSVKKFLAEAVSDNVRMICTDQSQIYHRPIAEQDWTPRHQTVNHSELEFVRGIVHTNTIEGAFSLLQRGIIGTYHQLSHKHLDRYLTEFEYKYNNRKRTDLFTKTAIAATERKPLPYKKLIGKVQ